MPFKNRWRIDGLLTTQTALHIGSGELTQRHAIVDEKQEPVEISAVAVDHEKRAYIPGKTLKGNLRAWLDPFALSPRAVEEVFGSLDVGAEDAVGGKAEFWDAYAEVDPNFSPQAPDWDSVRLTGVMPSVAINRSHRTVQENKLFYQEFVPPGVSFRVTLSGQDLDLEELDVLLLALEGFNDPERPVQLGAQTVNGQGRCRWELHNLARLEPKDMSTWMTDANILVGYDGLLTLSANERIVHLARAQQRAELQPSSQLGVTLEVAFDGPFLVNDPSQTRKKQEKRTLVDDENRDPDHMPRRDEQGHLLLPASSLRGALRSQAEKIVRTLNPAGACPAVDPQDTCRPLEDARQRRTHLCLACQVFGAAGWRSPLKVENFSMVTGCEEILLRQEFLAVDRFTGGGAHKLKFNALAVYQPVVAGSLSIDLARSDPWAIGLRSLTLRDLIEGDIPLGFGAAKGYGACRASVRKLKFVGKEKIPAAFQALLESHNVTAEVLRAVEVMAALPPEVEGLLCACVAAFQQHVVNFEKSPSAYYLGGTHVIS